MHITAIIPARYASTRLPIKPLVNIAGKTLINRVYDAVINTNLFHKVIVATDHQEIFDHVKSFSGEVMMTSENHISGTDRIEECSQKINTDLIINVQGDEPFIQREPLEKLIKSFDDKNVNVASLMSIITDDKDIINPNIVKVVCDINTYAIYFSRSVIPFNRDSISDIVYYKHIGVYAFRPDLLKIYVSLPPGKLENIEKLEQLRLLENGYKIKMIETDYSGIGIDTIDDIKTAEKMIFDRE